MVHDGGATLEQPVVRGTANGQNRVRQCDPVRQISPAALEDCSDTCDAHRLRTACQLQTLQRSIVIAIF